MRLLREVCRGRDLRNRLLARKAKLFFIDRTRDLRSLSKEIKILANRFLALSYRLITSKGIIVEHIIRLI